MRYLSTTLFALLLGAAALSAAAAPATPASPKNRPASPAPSAATRGPIVSQPPSAASYRPPIVPNNHAPAAGTHASLPPAPSTGTAPPQ